MAIRDDILNDLTHQQIPDLSQRIFYTLTADKTVDTQRIARMLGFLIRRLNDREILSDTDIIEMLFGSVSLQRRASFAWFRRRTLLLCLAWITRVK